MSPANQSSSSNSRESLVRALLLGCALFSRDRLGAQSSPSAPASAARAARALGSACDTSWSAPRELLTADGLRIYVEGPSALATSRGLVLTGSPTMGWMSRTNFIDTMVPVRKIDPANTVGVTIDSRGVAVPLPRVKLSGRPQTLLVTNDRGSLRIIWATSSDTALTFSNLDSLWTSTLQGDVWSTPTSLVQGQRIRWFSNFTTLTDIAGAPLAIVPMEDTTRSPRGGFLLLRRIGAGWQRRWIGTADRPPLGSSVIATGATSIVVAFTGELSTGSDTSSNAVIVMRLAWGGSSRIATRVIRRVGRLAAVEPKLFRLGRDLHLLWIERENGHPGGRTLYESTSSDDGMSWKEPSATSLADEHRGLSIAVTGKRTAHAALLRLGSPGVTILSRHSEGWHVEASVPGALTAPTLSVANGALLLMYAAATESPEVRAMAPFTMLVTRPLRCEVR